MNAIEQQNLNAWYSRLPVEVRAKWTELVQQVHTMRINGKTIYPAQEDIFNALKHCHPLEVKAVIVGQDPYHGDGQAMGMSFSVRNGIPHPPSLVNILKELSSDIGCNYPKSGDLSKWETEGVLLLNTVLTVEAHKAFSHRDLGWQIVTTAILKSIMADTKPTVFIAWGSPAKTLLTKCADELIDEHKNDPLFYNAINNINIGICSTHPSPLSADKSTPNMRAFIGSRPFSKTNKILKEKGIPPINWAL